MIKKIALVSLIALSANADMTNFYKAALQHLQYDKTYTLYKHANKISQNAVTYSKYVNFSADASYSRTHAKFLPTTAGSFNTIDVAFHDTLDLFGKNNYKIQTLRLGTQMKKSTLNLKKEKLFISLSNMIALYNSTAEELQLHQDFYDEQKKIFNKLQILAQKGDITAFEILRFKNTLTTLQTTIASQEQELKKMKMQLHSFAPSEAIPVLIQSEILYTEKDFVAHNPNAKINSFNADRLLATSKGLQNTYMPTVELSINYQKLDDPTSYGNNHSFGATLHMPLNGGNFKEAEALKVAALSKKTQSIEYKIQRENEYIAYYQAYQNAKKQLEILEKARKDYEKSEITIKHAYLKQYVDFNTYLQVLNQALKVKKQIINMQSQEKLEATLINAIASGSVYD